MDWRGALRARLLGDGPLDAIVGNRIYIDDRPQGDPLPGLVLVIIDDQRPQHLKGFDLPPGRVQFDAYGAKSLTAWQVSDAALSAVIGPFWSQGHQFQRAEVALGQRSLPERVATTTVFRVSMDLIFHHAEAEEVS